MSVYRPKTAFHIAEPCSANWDDMQGDARSRHCAACSRDVHNLASMTAREIDALMAGAFTAGAHAPCVRMAQFDDGSLLAAAEPRVRSGYGAMAGVVMSALVTISSVAASAQQLQPTLGKMVAPSAVYSGQVLGMDGKPAPHAHVQLVRVVHGVQQQQRAETDAAGNFQMTAQPGEWSVSAWDGRGDANYPTQPVKLQPGEHHAAQALRLQRITVTAGAPVPMPPPKPVATMGIIAPVKTK